MGNRYLQPYVDFLPEVPELLIAAPTEPICRVLSFLWKPLEVTSYTTGLGFFESGSFIVEALEQLSQDDNVPKSLLERVSLTKPIRDKCLLILKESYESAAITANDIGDFIQKVHCDVSPVKGVNSYGSSIVESIDFFFCELFICSVCMLLETEDYIAVHDLLYRTYFLRKHWFSNEMPEPLPYDCFRKYLQAIEQSGRMQPGNEHSFSIVGDLLVSRELKPFWTAQKIRHGKSWFQRCIVGGCCLCLSYLRLKN